jgi:hypothetical protein
MIERDPCPPVRTRLSTPPRLNSALWLFCIFALSPQVADPSIPIGISEIGTMTSIFPIAYGFRWVDGWMGAPSPFSLDMSNACRPAHSAALRIPRSTPLPASLNARSTLPLASLQHCHACLPAYLPARPPARLPAASL